jgi:SLT domain-containing protein
MKTARSAFQTGYNTLNKLTGGRLGDLVDSVKSHASSMVSTFKKLPGRMADGIRNGYDAIKDAAVHIGNGLISGIAKGVNGVIGGIDWVLDKVHAPKIPKWKPKYFAQGGDALGLSVVGEKGKHELIKYPDGRIEVSPNKATLYNFKQPVKILGGDKTEQLMKLKVIPKYGLGNWIGDAVDFVKGGFSAVSKGASSFWKAITHPKELLNTAIDKFTDLSGLQGTVLDMAKGTVSTVADQALAWVKSKLELAGDPPGSGVERWRPYVVRALAMNDLSTSKGMVEKVLRQIKTESGGNAKAVQHGYTDVNTLSGDLAKGLMQTISATFNANKFSGHGDIFNGFDNLLAALHYAKNRYGASLSALGKGHGYANGGIVTTEQMAHIAEGNKAEMVIPLTNQNRALQLMYQALDYFKGNDSGSGSQKQLGGDNSILTDLLTKLLTATLQQNQILATELGKTPIVQISISDIMHAAAQYTSRKRAF